MKSLDIVPGHIDNRPVAPAPALIVRRVTTTAPVRHTGVPLGKCNLVLAQLEVRYRYAVNRSLALMSITTQVPHAERAAGDGDHFTSRNVSLSPKLPHAGVPTPSCAASRRCSPAANP